MADKHTPSNSPPQLPWAERIGRHMLPEGSVLVPPRIAKALDEQLGILSERRIMLRASDPEAYEVLSALHLSALGYKQNVFRPKPQSQVMSDIGQKGADEHVVQQQSNYWLTTLDAAELTGVHDRTIRRWIAAQRLPARRHGGRWLVHRQYLNIALAA